MLFNGSNMSQSGYTVAYFNHPSIARYLNCLQSPRKSHDAMPQAQVTGLLSCQNSQDSRKYFTYNCWLIREDIINGTKKTAR